MLTEKNEISIASVQTDGVIFVKKTTTILKDGEPFGSPVIWRGPLNPGDSLDGQDQIVVAVANAVWTPEIVAAYQSRQTDQID